VIGHPVSIKNELDFALEPTLTEVALQEEMEVKEAKQTGNVTILDFGQNFAGIVEIDPSFLTNETITIRHGEILNADGSLYTANLRKAKATIVYHAGAEKKKYRPRFTYMGFRYMELSGVDYQSGMIKAYAIHTDMKRTGYFSCENPMVQKLYENQVWGQKSNYVEVPTDCPQRDERMGYTGDGQVFARTGAYNFDTNDFWKNFLRDLELGQLDNTEGYVCATVPQTGPAGIGFISMLGWGNAVTILPEMLYQQFGDEEALPRQYESMKLFVEAEIRKMGKKNLWIGPSLGDWLAMGKGIAWQAMHNNPVSNAFIVHDLKVISETAERLGKKADADRYRRQLEATTKAYIEKFVSKKGIVAKDYQSAYIMALKFVLPEGELRELVKKTAEMLSVLPPVTVYEPEYVPKAPVIDASAPLDIHREDDGTWIVEGPWLQRLMGSINFGDYESRMYFDRVLRQSGLFDRLEEMGIRIPEQAGVIGFDNTYICEYLYPRLSSIAQPIEEMAALTVQRLIHRLDHPDDKSVIDHPLHAELISRESSLRKRGEK